MSLTLNTAQKHTLSWLLIAAAAACLLGWLAPVLAPFVVAGVLAYALQPAVEALCRCRLPRWMAAAVVVLAAVLAVLSLLLLLAPVLARELPQLRDQIPVLAERLNAHAGPWLAQFGIKVQLDVAGIKAMALRFLDGNLEDWLLAALSSARIGGSIVLALLGNAVLVPVVLYYLLLDWDSLVRRLAGLVPPRWTPAVGGFLTECDGVLGQYLRGQLAVMLSLSLYYSAALALAGFELAVPVGVFTGMAVFIPYLGFGLGLVLALLVAALQFQGWYGVGVVALVYGVGQVVESFVLTPRLVGERIGLSPLAVIFALLAAGHLLGFVGVLVALPVSAVLLVAGRRLKATYLQSELYRG